ncbi:MAG TPA: inositol monophosphatase family protein [Candidatus Limnocylindria bacterium]|nr:inositol monophosphatase family protein [Candidatus Limnocylindria bacterium]
MATFEAVAREAAGRAGDVLRRHFGRVREVRHKGDVDLVTAADREAEAVILEGLRTRFPEHRVVAEESGEHPGGTDYVWYVDPLDGTTNFVHGVPHFAVSIALAAEGQLVAAVVHDPMRHETFHATRGSGAFLNGQRIAVSTAASLDVALVATGFPYDRRQAAGEYVPTFEAVLRRTQDIRRAGAAALDLAYVACGRFDGYWESGLQPWDTAAGSLLVSEAGGCVSSYDGSRPVVPYRDIVATNGALHDALRALILASRSAPSVDGSRGL